MKVTAPWFAPVSASTSKLTVTGICTNGRACRLMRCVGLLQKKPGLVGTDNLSLGVPDLFDAHRVLLIENGIYVMKSLNLESLAADQQTICTVVVLPLKIKGGEASLIRPIAIA